MEIKGVHTTIVDGEEVLLKKNILGWHVVHPWKNKDGSINWENFLAGGSWIKLLLMAAWVGIMVGAIFEYTSHATLLTKCLAALNDSIILVP